MANEPERPIEKLLRAAARKRRGEAGARFQLHPATRRLLQGEVTRRYPRAEREVGWVERWLRLWPRLAWALGIFVVLGVALWLVVPGGTGSKPGYTLAKDDRPAEDIKRDKIVPPQLIDEIEGMFENEEYQEALELCESEPNCLTNMLAAALPMINQGFDTMKSAMNDVAEEEAIKLQQKISYLSLVGNIAPMLGLFGTVTGMISAFQTIARIGAAVTPADLATASRSRS